MSMKHLHRYGPFSLMLSSILCVVAGVIYFQMAIDLDQIRLAFIPMLVGGGLAIANLFLVLWVILNDHGKRVFP